MPGEGEKAPLKLWKVRCLSLLSAPRPDPAHVTDVVRDGAARPPRHHGAAGRQLPGGGRLVRGDGAHDRTGEDWGSDGPLTITFRAADDPSVSQSVFTEKVP